MNKRQKETQQVFLDNEKEVLKKVEANYQDALDEINSKIELLLSRQDADMQHVIYQVEYQKALKTQVQAILEQLQTNEFETVSEYLAKSYEDGFIGTMYDLQGQGIPLVFPIDQKAVVDAIQADTNLSEDLYTAMGKDITELKKKITGEISRGLSSGQMYSEIARNIAGWARIPKNNAMRIARTESHRIQCKATMDACHKAKTKGADIVRQWDASLDGKTRDSHRQIDGEIRELDEPFSNGLMYPGDPSGAAKEVINCRCALLQRARWALGNDYTKWSPDEPVVIDDDGTTQFAIIEAKNYKDFQKKYKQATERVREDAQKMNGFNKAQTIEEAQERIAKASGGAKVDFADMDIRVANDYLQGVEEFYSEYPELKGYIEAFDTRRSNIAASGQFEVEWNMDAATFRPKAKIHFAKQSYEEYLETIKENVESGYKYDGASGITTAKHELVHALQSKMYYMEKGLYKDGEFVEQNIFSFKESKYSFISDSNKIVNKASKKVYGKESHSDKIKYLGDYAKQDRDELVAQAVSYEMTGKTHPFSAEVKHIFDEKYEKTFGAKPVKTTLGNRTEKMYNGAKLSETTDKWSREAKEELLMDEKSLSVRKKETACVYSGSGKFLFQKRGTEDEITFTVSEFKKLKGSVITHNHPAGSSFSNNDIVLLQKSKASEIRVSAEDCIYYIRQPKKWNEAIASPEKLKAERDKIKESVKQKYIQLYKEGKITKVERHRMATDEVNTLFCERFGIEYGKEYYDD